MAVFKYLTFSGVNGQMIDAIVLNFLTHFLGVLLWLLRYQFDSGVVSCAKIEIGVEFGIDCVAIPIPILLKKIYRIDILIT